MVAALARATGLSGEDAIRLAKRLYGNQFSADHPLTVEVAHLEALAELKALCDSSGIAMDVLEA